MHKKTNLITSGVDKKMNRNVNRLINLPPPPVGQRNAALHILSRNATLNNIEFLILTMYVSNEVAAANNKERLFVVVDRAAARKSNTTYQ